MGRISVNSQSTAVCAAVFSKWNLYERLFVEASHFMTALVTFGKQSVRYELSVTKTDLSASVDGDVVVAPNHTVPRLLARR